MKTNVPADALPPGKYAIAQNVRALLDSAVRTRPGQTQKFSTAGSPITDIAAYTGLNTDNLPRYLARDSTDRIWLDNGVQVGSLAPGGPGAVMIPFRPGASPTPYIYAANGADYQKFSAPANNLVTQQKAGIAEPQTAPDAGVQVVKASGLTGNAASYAAAGTASAPADVFGGIANETITQVVADPVASNAWSAGISGYNGVSTFAFGEIVTISLHPYFVQDWINPNSLTQVTIGSITYYSGTTGHCVIVPSGLANSPSVVSSSGQNPSQQSIFDLSPVPSIRRGALLQLSGSSEVVYVLSVVSGPNGQICIETSTVNTHAAGETFTVIPTLLLTSTSAITPTTSNVRTSSISSAITGAGVGTLTFAGYTFVNADEQEGDYVCIFLEPSVATAFTEIRIEFDVGDGSFTNYLYYSIAPSAFVNALGGTATTLGDAQLSAQQTQVQSSLTGAGSTASLGAWFTPIVFPVGALIRVGNNGNGVTSTNALRIWINASAAFTLNFGSIVQFGGGIADVGDQGSPYFYRVRPRSAATGARGNPSPATRYGVSPRREQVKISMPSAAYDSQIDTWDIFRYGGTVTSWRYIGSTLSTTIAFIDNFDDSAASAGEVLDFDNFEPWPSIDVPFNAIATSVSGFLALVTVNPPGNIPRFLPGNLMQLAGGNVYTLRKRPVLFSGATYLFEFVENAGSFTNVTANIYEPALANQHLPYMFGPDVSGTVFACGDPLRAGTLYFAKNYAPDSAPDSYNIEITPPSEPLLGGEVVDGLAFAASPERWWALYPQPDNPAQRYAFVQQPFPRGLAAPYGHTTDGVSIFWWAKDGIQSSSKGSLTDDDLYNLFPHDGVPGQTVTYMGTTVNPPDYSRAGTFRLTYSNYYLYATYQDSTGTYRQLVLDTRRGAWCVDSYSPAVSAFLHPQQPAGTLLTSTARYDELVMGTIDGRVAVQTDNSNDLGAPSTTLPFVASAEVAGTGSQQVTLSAPVKVGDFLFFVWVDSETSTPTSTLPSDNLGNAYNNNTIRSDNSTYVAVFGSSFISVAGTPTITIPFPVGKTGAFVCIVFRADVSFDRQALGGPTNTNSLTVTMSGSTTLTPDYIISAAVALGTGLSNGEGILANVIAASNNFSAGISYRLTGVTGVFSTTWSQSGSTIMNIDLLAREYTPPPPMPGVIVCILDTAEFDGGDSRAPKQWGDVFLDATPASANLTVTPVSLGAQVIAPIAVAQSASRVRQPLGVGGIFVSDFMGLAISWTDDFTQQSVATQLHIWHPSFVVQPAYTQSWFTFGTTFGLDGFKHVPRLILAWVSTTPITLTVTSFDGQSPPAITIPSSGGAYQKQLFMLGANKGLLYKFQATSTAKFQLFLEDSEIHVGAWQRSSPYAIFHALGGQDAGPI